MPPETLSVLPAATERFLQAGLLGTIVVVFALVIYVLWRRLETLNKDHLDKVEALMNKRFDDSKTTHAQLTDVIKTSTEMFGRVAGALDNNREALGELRRVVTSLSDDVDEMRRHSAPPASGPTRR